MAAQRLNRIGVVLLCWLSLCFASCFADSGIVEECANDLETAPKDSTSEEDKLLGRIAEDCGAKELFADEEVPGLHILCRTPDRIVVWRNSQEHDVLVNEELTGEADYDALREWLETTLKLEEFLGLTRLNESSPPPLSYPKKYPWNWFSADGKEEIKSMEQVKSMAPVLIFKGGVYIYPGVRVGHTQVVQGLQGISNIIMKTVSMTPLVFEMEHFLTDDECTHIQNRSSPHMAPSPVSKMDHDQEKDHDTWRTSTTYFLNSGGDPILEAVEQRVADLTRVPISHQEDAQVLRYEIGQQYDAHHDFFNPAFYQASENIIRMIDGGRRNRMITVFWYLSDVPKGGETVFPRVGGYKGPVDFKSCDGLRVTPIRGKVAMFYSMMPDGRLDDFSLHGACPVQEGQKWAANKWVWNSPFRNF